MKILACAAAAAACVAVSAPAQAAAWRSVNARQNLMFAKIETGVRNGALTRNEAYRLRRDFYSIARLERRYRWTGHHLSAWERRDLNRRLHNLDIRIHNKRHNWRRRY